VTLSAEMVNLIRLNVVDEIGELSAVCEVPIVKKKTGLFVMGINIQVVNPFSVKAACPPDKTMDFITFR
jgi:hypothetical protein